MESSSSFSSLKHESHIINNKYKVLNKISSGSFGVVYKGKNIYNHEEYAIKMEKAGKVSTNDSLSKEYILLKKLENVKGIPKAYYFGLEKGYHCIVMTLLSYDLSSYVKKYGALNIRKLTYVFKQILRTLEGIHKNGILHRDIKPENILTQEKSNLNNIFIVDFGISKCFNDRKGKHIPFVMNKSFIGTLRYASENSHKGYELSRRGFVFNKLDDLESLFYSIIFLSRGNLPWQNINAPNKEKKKQVGKIKSEITPEILCKNLPDSFTEILKYNKGLQFADKIDFDYLLTLLEKVEIRMSNGNKKSSVNSSPKLGDDLNLQSNNNDDLPSIDLLKGENSMNKGELKPGSLLLPPDSMQMKSRSSIYFSSSANCSLNISNSEEEFENAKVFLLIMTGRRYQ